MGFWSFIYPPDRTDEVLAALAKLSQQLTKTRSDIMAELSDLTAAVANLTTVEDSALALIQGMAQRLQNIVDSSNDLAAMKAGLQTEIDNINTDAQKMADAVAANTPAAP